MELNRMQEGAGPALNRKLLAAENRGKFGEFREVSGCGLCNG